MAKEAKMTTEELVKSQSNYKGDSHFEYVDIEIIEAGSFYKKGDKDRVHPSLAQILLKKGLIKTIPNVKKIDTSKLISEADSKLVVDGVKTIAEVQ